MYLTSIAITLFLEAGSLWLPTLALPTTDHAIEATQSTSSYLDKYKRDTSTCDIPPNPGDWVATNDHGQMGTVISTNEGGSVVSVALCDGEHLSYPCDALIYVFGGY
jgi:hypothetical protein